MSWRRTQRSKQKHTRGERASDDEIRKRIRKAMPKPTQPHKDTRTDDFNDDWELDDVWDDDQ